MPKLKKTPNYLKDSEARYNAAVGAVGFDFITLINTLIPVIGQIIALCKKPVPPAPPNPEPNPTPAQQAAWNQAHEMHWLATTSYVGGDPGFRQNAINSTARKIFRSKKKNGEEVSKPESKELAAAALHEAYLNDVPTLAKLITDSQ